MTSPDRPHCFVKVVVAASMFDLAPELVKFPPVSQTYPYGLDALLAVVVELVLTFALNAHP
jgi:hypothetical protein